MDRNKFVLALMMTSLLALGACSKEETADTDKIGGNAAGEPTISTDTPEEGTRRRQPAPENGGTAAAATLQGAPEDTDFAGTITVMPEGNGVRLVADVRGVDRDGKHGFHVHETGECAHGEGSGHFTSAGGHFNPNNAEHTCPPTEQRHAGDLGNIEITNGTGRLDVITDLLTLSGPNSVVGKAIILHANEDDCQTQPTGNAGDRLACGVVTMGTSGGRRTQGQ
jgi:Cu-Zn family superoxide dismutase